MSQDIENTNLNVSLPKRQKDYVKTQAAATGCGTASEYVRRLIHQDERTRAREALEAKLLEGLAGDDVEMTSEDWASIRRDVLEGIERRRRND